MILENTTKIRVRYADTDKMGIVYNSMYLVYFESGRTELMREKGVPYSEFEKEGFWLPLVDAYVKYISPAYYDDMLDVITKTDSDNIGATIRFDYKIENKGKIIAEGYTRHSFMNSTTRKAVRPPAFFLELLKKTILLQ